MDRKRTIELARAVIGDSGYTEDNPRAIGFIALIIDLSWGWSLAGDPVMLGDKMLWDENAVVDMLRDLRLRIVEERANE